MDILKNKLIEQAFDLYNDIRPCGEKTSFEECFTIYNDKILFWFNIPDNTTKVLVHNFN